MNTLQKIQLDDYVATITYAGLPENELYRGLIERWAVINHLGNICDNLGSTLEIDEPDYYEEFMKLSRVLPTDVMKALLQLNPIYVADEPTAIEQVASDPTNTPTDKEVKAAKFFIIAEAIGGFPTGKMWILKAEDHLRFLEDREREPVRGQQFITVPSKGKTSLNRTLTDVKLIARCKGLNVRVKSYLKGYTS